MNPAHVGETREPYEPPHTNGTGVPPPGFFDDEPSAAADEHAQRTPPASPVQIVERWRVEGPLVRVPTGIRALDEACRGGLPLPWRALIIGAPSAGKTAVATIIADTIAREALDAGLCVGILAVDEEPDDVTVRLAQIAGFTVAQAELRAPDVLDRLALALESVRVRLYDATWTIEAAGADLATWTASEARLAALFIDSIQAARSARAAEATSPRELVEANVAAMRLASTAHRMLVVATSEANRNSYRSEQATEQSNDMAAGAESRAIEFGAQTLLMLRTPKDHADVIHVRLVKNRRARVGEFWLRLDREAHRLTACDNPEADPSVATERAERKRAANRADLARKAKALMGCVRGRMDLSARDLRTAVKLAGHKWGHETLPAIIERAAAGVDGERLVNRGDPKRCRWNVEALAPADQRFAND
jgi:KaiC/GvpD/RAD55 family RecA-like ATPase